MWKAFIASEEIRSFAIWTPIIRENHLSRDALFGKKPRGRMPGAATDTDICPRHGVERVVDVPEVEKPPVHAQSGTEPAVGAAQQVGCDEQGCLCSRAQQPELPRHTAALIPAVKKGKRGAERSFSAKRQGCPCFNFACQALGRIERVDMTATSRKPPVKPVR